MERRKLLSIIADLNPAGLKKTVNTKDEDTNDLKNRVQGHVDDLESHDDNIKRKIDKLDEQG